MGGNGTDDSGDKQKGVVVFPYPCSMRESIYRGEWEERGVELVGEPFSR
jgi:hypothetical protein